MIAFSGILYYLFFSSTVLIYGIGLKRSIVVTVNADKSFLSYIKSLIVVTFSSFLSWLFIKYILIPGDMIELYPLICIFIVLSISVFCESLIRLTSHNSTAEIAISFLCVIISVNESTTMLQSVIYSSLCVSCCFFIIPLLLVMRKRLSYASPHHNFSHGSLLFISLAIILLAMISLNISWLAPGVIE